MLLAKKRLKFYVTFKGHKTDLFNSWPYVLDSVSMFNAPLWAGFDIRHDAFVFVRKQLGINFYISPSIKNKPLEFDIAHHPSILRQNCISKSVQRSQLTKINEELLKQRFANKMSKCLYNKISRQRFKLSAFRMRH